MPEVPKTPLIQPSGGAGGSAKAVVNKDTSRR